MRVDRTQHAKELGEVRGPQSVATLDASELVECKVECELRIRPHRIRKRRQLRSCDDVMRALPAHHLHPGHELRADTSRLDGAGAVQRDVGISSCSRELGGESLHLQRIDLRSGDHLVPQREVLGFIRVIDRAAERDEPITVQRHHASLAHRIMSRPDRGVLGRTMT